MKNPARENPSTGAARTTAIFLKRGLIQLLVGAVTCVILFGCSASRHVAEGSYLLDKVKINIDSSSNVAPLNAEELLPYLRQQPNHRILWFLRLRLGVYNMSGKDSANWFNKWIRKLGEPPVIYDASLTEESARQLKRALINKGYPDAVVKADTLPNARKRKMKVVYNLHPGSPMIVDSLGFAIPDSAVRAIDLKDSAFLPV